MGQGKEDMDGGLLKGLVNVKLLLACYKQVNRCSYIKSK